MSLLSLAIVGKNNEPLFMKEYTSDSDDLPEAELFGLKVSTGGTDGFSAKGKEISLKQQFILHAALDRLEELDGPPPGFAWRSQDVTGTDAMWIGLLLPVEEMRVYGYMTTTKVKFMAVVDDNAVDPTSQKVKENDVKRLMVSRVVGNSMDYIIMLARPLH